MLIEHNSRVRVLSTKFLYEMLVGTMSLPILALAFAVYILGIAVILYFRPRIMFQPGGDWKEFGIGRGESHTVLPFWLFAIFWAFISYGVSLVVLSQFAHVANSSLGIPVYNQSGQSVPSHPMPQITQQMPPTPSPVPEPAPVSTPGPVFKPVSSMLGLQENQPGYYVLANNTQNGNPQYIYYGSNPPKLGRY